MFFHRLVLDVKGLKIYKYIGAGIFEVNTYVLAKDGDVLVVDPCILSNNVLNDMIKVIEKNLKNRIYIFNTHGHLDHICSNMCIKEKFNAKILIHEEDSYLLEDLKEHEMLRSIIEQYDISYFNYKPHKPDIIIQNGYKINISDIEFIVFHTPGHTKGSSIIYSSNLNIAFTGDTIMYCNIGRIDLPHSNVKQMIKSLGKIMQIFNDETLIFPGHGIEAKFKHLIPCISNVMYYLSHEIEF